VMTAERMTQQGCDDQRSWMTPKVMTLRDDRSG
jgi:hypothetical protein